MKYGSAVMLFIFLAVFIVGITAGVCAPFWKSVTRNVQVEAAVEPVHAPE